jgi:hypothetical protein
MESPILSLAVGHKQARQENVFSAAAFGDLGLFSGTAAMLTCAGCVDKRRLCRYIEFR